MSRTTASNGSWTLIHYAQATYMTTATVIMHMHICTPAVVPGVALPSTEDYCATILHCTSFYETLQQRSKIKMADQIL